MILKFFKKKSSLVFLVLLLISIILEASFRLFPHFAEFYTLNVSSILKYIYTPVQFLPFSFSETLIIVFGLLFSISFSGLIIHPFFHFFKKEFAFNYKAIFVLLTRALVTVFFLFVTTFSSSYHRLPVASHLDIDTSVTENDIRIATETVAEELISIADQIPYTPNRPSSSGLSFSSLSKEIKRCADKAEEKYPFLRGTGSIAKPLVSSELLTYMHIAGIYTFFTGEPCVNTNYSSYTLPYTMAHEFAHQRGIGAEDEADFAAYLIAMESDNAYVRYSALAEAFVSLSNELYLIDPDAFWAVCSALPDVVLNDFDIERSYYSKYSNSQLGEISSTVNDTYLKANGVEHGVGSYRESVILLASYLAGKEK